MNQPLAAFQVCHQNDDGVLNAIVDPHMRYILALGKHNELVCTKINIPIINDKALRNALWLYYGYKEIFTSKPTVGFYPGKYFLFD